jgi:alpha-L-fucosidase
MKSDDTIVIPEARQVEWAEAEIGVLFHYDMQVFNPEYQWNVWGTHPEAKTFAPTNLDTDQWMEAAGKLGAKYAILTAKHGCGFCLWPTGAHEYSVKQSPWKNGNGDIVKDFIASAKKYGIKPGLYANTSSNGYLYVDNPGLVQPGAPFTQAEYARIAETQLTELWTNYGELFEIWFDGGVLAVDKGGPDVVPLLKRLQPNAIAFQGPADYPNLIRWVGNERGAAPYPSWSTAHATTNADGTT